MIEMINDRFKTLLELEIGVRADPVALNDWHAGPEGWTLPVISDTDEISVSYCPELIAQTHVRLDTEELDRYLTFVEWLISRRIIVLAERRIRTMTAHDRPH